MKDIERERVGSFLIESEINEGTDDEKNNITQLHKTCYTIIKIQ